MPSFQNGELLPKREIFQNEVATALKSADECPEQKEKMLNMARSYIRSWSQILA